MNAKFFDVKKEKQDSIINACLKIFSQFGYKKASTDVIVKEAGISKGLLFHYFESKKGTYEFVYDYSIRYMTLELTQTVKKGEKDFFEIQKMIEQAKTVVMKNYPYMQQFINGTKYETHPDALAAIGENSHALQDVYNQIYKQADMTRFADQIDVTRVINMISWMSQGFIRDKFNGMAPNLDEMNEEFGKYLSMIRDHFYKGANVSTPHISISEPDNDEPVIKLDPKYETKYANSYSSRYDEMQAEKEAERAARAAAREEYTPELSFEERLAAGKRPLVDIPVEEKDSREDVEAVSESYNENTANAEAMNAEAINAEAINAEASSNISDARIPKVSGNILSFSPNKNNSSSNVDLSIHDDASEDEAEDSSVLTYPSDNPASEREVRQLNQPKTPLIPVYPGFGDNYNQPARQSFMSTPPQPEPVQGGYKVQRRTFAELASKVISEEVAAFEEDNKDSSNMTEEERMAEDLKNMGPAPVLPEYHAPAPKNVDDGIGNNDGQSPFYFPPKF